MDEADKREFFYQLFHVNRTADVYLCWFHNFNGIEVDCDEEINFSGQDNLESFNNWN